MTKENDKGPSPQLPVSGDKVALLDLSLPQLAELLRSLGQPSFRARQIYSWVYRELASDFQQMVNLPKTLRDQLSQVAYIEAVLPIRQVADQMGLTHKVLFQLQDGHGVEAVLMLYPSSDTSRARRTVCLSSQVGCAIGCPFCATGREGLIRNLGSAEMVAQVLHFARWVADKEDKRARITNVVVMGQGEPLANLAQVWRAIETLNSPYGFGLGARHITLSTAGLVPQVRELAAKPLQVGLAVSLHAPNDALRDQLVPINRRYPLANLLAACQEYTQRTRRRVTFEYALIAGVNDSLQQARELAKLLRGLLCHVNIIPLSPTPESPFQPAPHRRLLAFQAELARHGIAATVRVERGTHIGAACGQLRSHPLAESPQG